ncbi:hypothetical protein GCM10009837_20480 [Streptomyces durmitorensis]
MLAQLLRLLDDQRPDQADAVGEVPEDRAFAGPGGLGDVGHLDGVGVGRFLEQPGGGCQQRGPVADGVGSLLAGGDDSSLVAGYSVTGDSVAGERNGGTTTSISRPRVRYL